MNERFIAVSTGPHGGHWGAGSTQKLAEGQLRKAGAANRHSRTKVIRFYSELPFAPSSREARKDEADCWFGNDGSIYWVRCEREDVVRV